MEKVYKINIQCIKQRLQFIKQRQLLYSTVLPALRHRLAGAPRESRAELAGHPDTLTSSRRLFG